MGISPPFLMSPLAIDQYWPSAPGISAISQPNSSR
jgi:hypothetical protein